MDSESFLAATVELPVPKIGVATSATDPMIRPALGIRSFVRREGRLTPAQRRALQSLWQKFGVTTETGPLEPLALFGRLAPLVLEIGFGDGESLVQMAQADPACNYLGIEVHRPGVGHLLLRAEALGLTHLRILCADAVEVLEQRVVDACIDRVQVFFPDPWPKLRHQKRRLIQPGFIDLLGRKLKSGAVLHLVTDCPDYAHSMRATLNATSIFTLCSPPAVLRAGLLAPVPRPVTRFERRGLRLGHSIEEIVAVRG